MCVRAGRRGQASAQFSQTTRSLAKETARFAHLAFAFRSMRFHELPWAEPIMREEGLQPRVRMNRLFEAGLAALRAEETRT